MAIKHIKTSKHTTTFDVCKNCPNKLFNKDTTIYLGTGNVSSGICMILPTYDFKNTKNYETILTKLQEVFKELTGKELLEEVYVTRLVKCTNKSSYNTYSQCINNCIRLLVIELLTYKMPYIIMFGDTYDSIANYIDIHPEFAKLFNNKQIFKIYSPGVLFFNNEDIIDAFKNNLGQTLEYLSV